MKSRNIIPSRFMLQELEISADLMRQVALTQTFHVSYLSVIRFKMFVRSRMGLTYSLSKLPFR